MQVLIKLLTRKKGWLNPSRQKVEGIYRRRGVGELGEEKALVTAALRSEYQGC